MTNKNVDLNEIKKFQSISDDWWDTQGPLKTLHQVNQLRLDYVTSATKIKGKRILDVGCGGGIFSESLAKLGANVTGIDLADSSLNVAINHAKKSNLNISYKNIDIESLSEKQPNSFDIVVCFELLEHVPNPKSIISSCNKIVANSGDLFFSTINRNIKSYLLAIVIAEKLLNMIPKGTHEYQKLIRPSELISWSRKEKLILKDITGLHYNPINDNYFLNKNYDVNYFCHLKKCNE